MIPMDAATAFRKSELAYGMWRYADIRVCWGHTYYSRSMVDHYCMLVLKYDLLRRDAIEVDMKHRESLL